MSEPNPASTRSETDAGHETAVSEIPVSDMIRGRSLQDVIAASCDQSAERQIAMFWADMRFRISDGQNVTAENYLHAIADSESTGAERAVDLIYSEYALREEHGEQVCLEEYQRRFPQYIEALDRQITLHEALQSESQSVTKTVVRDSTVQSGEPERIGKYVIVAKIGSGGQSTVYRAVHPELGIDVAIKLGRAIPGDVGICAEMLQSEGQLLSHLTHPNLARVFDLGVHQNQPYLVLEYVRGPNLRQYVQLSRPTPRQAALIIARVARALFVVHQSGILHLDVKPANIAMDSDGAPRLIDFGLSRRFDAWSDSDSQDREGISGTVVFMSPEQAGGGLQQLDQRADTFSLGATLYYLLLGQPPYATGVMKETIRKAQSCEWDRDALDSPTIPKQLRHICGKAMAAQPDDRFATVDEFAQALESFAEKPRAIGAGVAAVAAGLLIIVSVIGWTRGWWSSAVRPDAGETIPAGIVSPVDSQPDLALNVRVFESDGSYSLIDRLPLQNGDQLQVRATIAPGLHATLFLWTSDGELRELARVDPNDAVQTLHYPTGVGQSVAMTGSAGTEFLFVCTATERPVSASSLKIFGDSHERWPAIPDFAVLRVRPDGVDVESYGRTRDFGPPSDLPNPEVVVVEQLERLRQELLRQSVNFDGIAFAHRE